MIAVSASRSNYYIGRVKLYQDYKKIMLLRVRGQGGHISSKLNEPFYAILDNSIY